MLLHLIVPRINDYMTEAIVERVYPLQGQHLEIGAKLLDITVDLSGSTQHDCPPVSHYRLVLRERAWLRRLTAARRETAPVAGPLALFTTEPDEPIDGPSGRGIRVAVAAIIYQPSWELS